MYKLTNSRLGELESIQRLTDGAFIPFAPDNSDYQAYLAWVAEGGIPLPADEVTV